MKKNLLLFIHNSALVLFLSGFFILNSSFAQTPNWQWAKSVGGTNFDYPYSCATDVSGNIIVTGTFGSSSITFGTTVLINAGNYNMFIVKYDASGNVLWAKSAGGISDDEGLSCTTDANGNIIVAGYFSSPTITFGTTVLTNAGSYDIFIVKYDASGNVLWAKSAGGIDDDEGYSCATDASGNIIVTGYFSSPSISFGSTSFTNPSSYDTFIAKYDISGNVLWAKRAIGTDWDQGMSCVTDTSANIILTGSFGGPTLTFGTTVLTSAGDDDIFIVKYDTAGNLLWAKSAGGTGFDYGSSCATDASGNIIVTGDFQSPTITFGTTVLTYSGNTNTTQFTYDVFVVKYDASGNILWAKSAGGTDGESVYNCTTDASENTIVTGSFSSPTVTFGTTALNTAGSYDIFIVKYDASGNVLWAKSAGGLYSDGGSSCTTDSNGNIIVTGYFYSNSITFGTTVLTNAGSISSDDIFIAKLDTLSISTGIFYPTDKGDRVIIFPNPATNQVKVNSSNYKIQSIEIYDAIGKNVYSYLNRQQNYNELTIDVSSLETGIYFVIVNDGENYSTQKLIVQ